MRKRRREQHYWYIRFYEIGPLGRKQRSIYIGSDANAERVRALLDDLRAPAKFLRDTLALADLAIMVARPLRRPGRAS